ncbi:MAG: serine aminopeptidase domain-containing protein [Candidatus Thorarchaeota archaeon]
MPKKAKEHEKLEVDTKIVVATGLGGEGREYPDYYAKFGRENVIIVTWDKTCTNLDSHINKLKENIPKEDSFIAVGHSMGGAIWLELLSREILSNQRGQVLVGCSRKVRGDNGVEFIMKRPWWFLWVVVFGLTALFPIMLLIWRKKTVDTYREMWRFITKDGARKIHTQYNLTLKSLGTVTSVKNPDLPLVVVRLQEDTLVDKDDLEFTKNMFHNVHEQIIETNALHLTEKYDHITVEKIANEAEFLRLIPKKVEATISY